MNYLILSLALIVSPAWAGWEYVKKDVAGNSFYLDFETLRKDGNLRRIWQMVELADGHVLKWGSVRQRNEYDCKNETKNIMSASAFSQKNLGGVTLGDSFKATEKEDVAPGSIDWDILKLICSK